MKIYKNYFIYIVLSFLIACNPNSKGNKFRPESIEIAGTKKKIRKQSHTEKDLVNASKNKFKVITWNIRDLGRTKTPDDLTQIAKILKNAHVVAIQEVVAKDPAGAQAVAKIADALNRMGNKWDYAISNPTDSPSANISERYAFLWKTSKVKLLKKPYLASEFKQVIYREPFVANFKFKNRTNPISIVNFHSRKHDDSPELEIFHFESLIKTLPYETVMIAGDFNLNEKHKVWKPLYKKAFKSALKNTKTTLKQKCVLGNYRNHAIDNVYYSSGITLVEAEVIDIVKKCENLDKVRHLSDHLPVSVTFY